MTPHPSQNACVATPNGVGPSTCARHTSCGQPSNACIPLITDRALCIMRCDECPSPNNLCTAVKRLSTSWKQSRLAGGSRPMLAGRCSVLWTHLNIPQQHTHGNISPCRAHAQHAALNTSTCSTYSSHTPKRVPAVLNSASSPSTHLHQSAMIAISVPCEPRPKPN